MGACAAATTREPHGWLALLRGSRFIVEGNVYLGDEDSDLAVFVLAAQRKVLAENTTGSAISSSPVVADNTFYISTRDHLVAIVAK